MEKLKAKHDHKLTDILKVTIFGIFLILPFMVYAPNALYYGVNEYAVNETTTNVDIEYKYESNEVNTIDDLIQNNVYTLKCNDLSIGDFLSNGQWISGYILNNVSLVPYAEVEAYYTIFNLMPSTFIQLYYDNGGNLYIYTYCNAIQYEQTDANVEYIFEGTFSDDLIIQLYDFNCNYTVFEYTDFNEIERVDIQENVEQTITESMNKAWQRMWQTPMFNWTSQSVLKQGLDNFTGVFGVSDTSYFTNLIVYELIMVAIYIVIDIVITMFKWLTHLIGEK